MRPSIRPGREEDYALLPDLEDAADEIYKSLPGFADLTANENITSSLVNSRPMDAGLFMAEMSGGPVGFVYFTHVDDCLFIEQIAVVRHAQRKGTGGTLLGKVWDEARGRGLRGVTLCTYRDVPWNMPFYQSQQFRELTSAELGPELAALFQKDIQRWSRYGKRVAMGRFTG